MLRSDPQLIELTPALHDAVGGLLAGSQRTVADYTAFAFGPPNGALVGVLLSFKEFSTGNREQWPFELVILDPGGHMTTRVPYPRHPFPEAVATSLRGQTSSPWTDPSRP